MKKFFNILNLILISFVLVGDIFYILYGTLLIKTITSIGFVLIGATNLVFAIKNKAGNLKFCVFMVVGLTFAMLGDVVLEIEFIVGAILFAVGHIFYFVSYCMLLKFKWQDLIYGVVIFVPATLVILLAPIFNFESVLMQIVCIIYAIIISIMTGKAISNFVCEKSILNTILMIGSVLFLFSDLMLSFNVFSNVSRIFGILCLATYYPAECFLGYSLFKTKKI